MNRKLIFFIISLLFLNVFFIKLVFAIELTSESQTVTTRVGNPPLDATSDISECSFYRGGDTVKAIKIGNPEMAQTIADIAGRVGVPPAILAGIMRVESVQGIMSTDKTYLTNDYDAHSSGVAFGVMQFTPATFIGVLNQNKAEMASLFNKTGILTRIDSQENMAPASSLRIYSIKDSIIATAFKVRNDKKAINGDGPWDEATVKRIASVYYSGGTCTKYPSCNAGPHDYGEDLWNSVSNCQPAQGNIKPAPPGSIVCPVTKGTGTQGIVTCGPSMPTRTTYAGCSAGHCAGNYPANAWCAPYPATSYAADIAGPATTKVYLPEITDPKTGDVHQLRCEYKGFEPSLNFPNQGIVKFSCQDTTNNNYVWIQFHHIRIGSQPQALGTNYISGQPIVGIIDEDHVHVQIGINGSCAGADTSGCVGADKYLQCK